METLCKTLEKMCVLITLVCALKISFCVFAENLDETISSNYSNVTTNNHVNGVSVHSIFNDYDGHNMEFTPLMKVFQDIRNVSLLRITADQDQLNISREHQNIIDIQQHACPDIPLCHDGRTNIVAGNCCPVYCSCNLTECMVERNCCPDVLINTYGDFPDQTEREEHCIPLSFDRRFNVKFNEGYYGVDDCPPGTDYDLASRCTGKYTRTAVESLAELIPCYSKINKTLYRNKFCAICNGLREENLLYFEVRVSQYSLDLWLNGTDTLLDLVMNTNVDEIEFVSPFHCNNNCYSGVLCEMVVSSCNQVGNWSDYDTDIERACHGYTNYFESPSSEYRGYFKNIFCYICNGFPLSEIRSCQYMITTTTTSKQSFPLRGTFPTTKTSKPEHVKSWTGLLEKNNGMDETHLESLQKVK